MAENDTQTELKKRARRRLVGAVALVTVTAIVLPAVMDHEPRQPVQDVQIRIPSQENANFPSRMLSGKAPPPARPVAGVAQQEQEGALPPSEEAPAPDAPPLRPAATQPAAPAAAPVGAGREVAAPVDRKPEPASQPESRKEVKPAAAQEKPQAAEKPHKPEKSDKPEKADKAESPKKAEKAEKARAEALLNNARPSDSAKSAYVIQLGAYKDESNVKSLRAKLKAEGYNSYTEQIGDRTRVRAGPFPSKEAADKAAARIRSILGVSAMVAGK